MSTSKYPLIEAMGLQINYIGLTSNLPWISPDDLEKALSEAPAVFCNKGPNGDTWEFGSLKLKADTHIARLVCIQEIKKEPCKHEPAEYDVNYLVEHGSYDPKMTAFITNKSEFKTAVYSNSCKHCGVKLHAVQWEECK